jgi:prepilin-type N-terminal cleavage/methylation domain-containing protein
MSALSTVRRSAGSAGFTLVELMVSIVIIAIIGTTFLVFFKSSLLNYLNLQSDAISMTQINTQAMRVATVMRGITNVTSASANDVVAYSYFYPSDAYVSVVHYYLQTSSGTTKLLADVTPMTSNPPIGTPISASQKTYLSAERCVAL